MKNGLRSFIIFLTSLFVLLILFDQMILMGYGLSYPRNIAPLLNEYINRNYALELNKTRGDLVVLGHSMAEEGIDQKALNAGLGRNTTLFVRGGTGSAYWYLLLKNVILASRYKPKYLVIAFTDPLLTYPDYKVSGSAFRKVDELASPSDTFLIDRAYIRTIPFFERWGNRYLPIFGERLRVKNSFDYRLRYTIPWKILGCNTDCIDSALNDVFAEEKQRPEAVKQAVDDLDSVLKTWKQYFFDVNVNSSFLPEIIRLCKENDIRLIMVRMPKMRSEQGAISILMGWYRERLKSYLEHQNVSLIDFSQDNRLSEKDFVDTLHMNKTGKKLFTEMLIEKLKPLLR